MSVITGALVFAAALAAGWLFAVFGLAAFGHLGLRRRNLRRTLWLGSVLARFPSRFATTHGAYLVCMAQRDLGEIELALGSTTSALEKLGRASCPWAVVNLLVDTFVSAGRYREALAAADGWDETAREHGRKSDPAAFAITRINQAEALHNLGRDQEALETLEEVAASAASGPMTRSVRLCLRAWIRVHIGELSLARRDLDAVDSVALAPRYSAEVEYTWAALERESGNLERASAHAERGLWLALRPSSERNGLFLVAGIAALAGNEVRARMLFQRGIEHAYRGQGGDGLRRYARFLDDLGEQAAAVGVRRLLVGRDPESVFAREARKRLEAFR